MSENVFSKILETLSGEDSASASLERTMTEAGVLEESKCTLRVALMHDHAYGMHRFMDHAVMHMAIEHGNLKAAALLLAYVEFIEELTQATDVLHARTNNAIGEVRSSDVLKEHQLALAEARDLHDALKRKQDLADELAGATNTSH